MPQMSVWMIVASIVAVLVFLLIGFVLGVMYRKKVSATFSRRRHIIKTEKI